MQPLRKLISIRLYLLSLIEAGLTALCYVAATYVYLPLEAPTYLEYESGLLRIGLIAVTFLIASYLFDFYKQIHVRSQLVLTLQLCQLVGIIVLLQAAFAFIHQELVLPQTVVLLGSAFTLLVLIAWRLFVRPALWNAFGAYQIVFVGCNGAVQGLAEAFAADPTLGMNVAGYVVAPSESSAVHPALGSYDELVRIVSEIKPDRIIVGGGLYHKPLLKKLFDLKSSGMVVEVAEDAYEEMFGRIYSRSLEPYTVIFRDELSARPGNLALQSIYTNLLALAGVLVTLPLMILIAIAIKVTRRGPVLSKNLCIGLHGIPFHMYRFRCSPLATDRISRLLVRYKLDGLPQALNIIRGEMALIGPRAERVEFDSFLSDLIPFYGQRHYVKPGVLGWSQLHCDPKDTEDTLARIEYDLYYIKHISLVLDAYILIRALKWVMSDREALA